MQTSERAAGVAVITGAASGMGEAAAQLMAGAGWPLLICDLDQARLDAAAARLPAGTAVESLAGDLSAPDFGAALAARLGDRPVGALIHCAGLSPTMAEPARILDVNLAATMRLVDVVRPRMAAGGAAVLFASTAAHMVGTMLDEPIGKVTTPEEVPSLLAVSPNSGAAYSVSKRGVQLLVKREAHGFGARDARIASVSPGVIDTPMGRQEMAQQPVMKTLVETSPLRRPAHPSEVAAVAVFLCSPAASFVTGIDVLVDGGSMTRPPGGAH